MLYCRLIDGRYPNYNSVIPADNPNTLTIDRRILLSAVRRMLPFASEASELIRFHLEPGKLELSAQDIDFATNAKEQITCDYNGVMMDIGFKGSSIIEILTNIECDNVVVLLADRRGRESSSPTISPTARISPCSPCRCSWRINR